MCVCVSYVCVLGLYVCVLGLQRYIFPLYDMYPDTVVTIRYTYTTQNKKGIASCLALGLRSLYS